MADPGSREMHVEGAQVEPGLQHSVLRTMVGGQRSEQYYPRALVIADVPFNRDSATGITMTNMFSGWPIDRLAIIYVKGSLDSRICSPTNAIRLGLWRWFLVGYLLRPILVDRVPRVAAETPGAWKAESSRKLGLLRTVQRLVRFGNELIPVLATRDVHRFIRRFQPDVVYSALGSLKRVRFVESIARRYSIPVVPHFFDDWPSFFYSDGFLGGYPQRTLHEALQRLMDHVPRGLCIGNDMAKEYSVRWGIPFDPMMNCVGDEELAAVERGKEPGERLVLTYIGGLHLNRWRPLLDVAKASKAYRFKIFAPSQDLEGLSDIFEPYAHVDLGTIPSDQVLGEMRRADILLHVESFENDTKAYTRLSVSTKIPQYYSVGRPILAYGPADVASVREIERAGAGIAVTSQEPQALADALQLLAGSAEDRERLGRSGRVRAMARYTKRGTTERLRKILSAAANGSA